MNGRPDEACGHRGCTAVLGDQWLTPPNLVTVLRTALTVALSGVVIGAQGGAPWLLAALASYWLGDLADGALARATRTETRTGAVLDILADRLSVCLVVIAFLAEHPEAVLPALIFLPQFVVLDAYLSLAFLNWSLLSPNYFGLVDRRVYLWNWSPIAKACNTGAVIVAWLITGNVLVTTAVAGAVLVVKSASAARLASLRVPLVHTGCAHQEAAVTPEPSP